MVVVLAGSQETVSQEAVGSLCLQDVGVTGISRCESRDMQGLSHLAAHQLVLVMLHLVLLGHCYFQFLYQLPAIHKFVLIVLKLFSLQFLLLAAADSFASTPVSSTAVAGLLIRLVLEVRSTGVQLAAWLPVVQPMVYLQVAVEYLQHPSFV